MKWFGTPWPTPEFRAPVCSDDADRVEVPVGDLCLRCGQMIVPTDRGVEIPLVLDEDNVSMVSYHARCWLAEVVGEATADDIIRRWADMNDPPEPGQQWNPMAQRYE